ncbi:TPA: GNAT family N-acetyltransferase [Klebsiella quasipneumoniae subsp. quasipneumoniae]|uniref:GNAT family N-acetyltransferase n=1 Tax=Klebsiella quasipneumoniae TaxID=1463165 RepID=UPI00066761DD|nr:GNAT family N-acetyltransferase [Klebsiella quasipneumoniae]MBC5116772.1 GNAT family N-acetyltransferase [Klebsiella quasipneumoniae]MBZ6708562.1 GNAT family N-acetyltransferase [Klebsiella quasipneumoniae]MCZ0716102.1 GNAT family N-acetyltransferase [Klebsiella quasipneumoniae]MDA5087367.1 GNAT family N-acetyltransferase [Klebsiella quasipneumoniae subsp. quasipneumoniae]MEB4701375.1 GNAT family N-acetyltransferase [Klebsiella quasipneumoniae]
MDLTAVPATQFSSVQLTDILNACFEAYLVPVTQSVEGFVQRFSAEGMSLIDSRVWLAGDEPAAIAIVARRGNMARLAAFALRPAWRGKGLGRKLMQELLTFLQQQEIETVSLEVIRDNHAAVALYQSLGFTRRYGLCGYLSAEPLAAAPGVLQPYPILALLRRAVEESNSQLPWLMDPLTFATLPCRVVTLEQRAFAVLSTSGSRPVLQFLWVEPAARRQGLAQALLMALAQQFPGIGTTVTVPETFTPLFAAAGYAPLSLQQYEMTMECAAAKSA